LSFSGEPSPPANSINDACGLPLNDIIDISLAKRIP
jgi:hypothetical protein